MGGIVRQHFQKRRVIAVRLSSWSWTVHQAETRFRTPGGRPAFSAISASRRADSGEASAGLLTTVQPAASAVAVFHVESMKAVFQGVMTPPRRNRSRYPFSFSVLRARSDIGQYPLIQL